MGTELRAAPEGRAGELAVRARRHAALGEPTRLVIVDELVLSDRSPRELADVLGIATNLLAHHLNVLDDAGLIERVPSAADGRGRYVRLRPEAAGLASAPVLRPTGVVFVCTGNSARSQLAEALWRRASGVPVTSGGTAPAPRVHPLAVEVAARHGLDLSDAQPRGFDGAALDQLIVSVCDIAASRLGVTEGRLHWSVANPAEAGTLRAFEDAYERIAARVERLARHVAAEEAS